MPGSLAIAARSLKVTTRELSALLAAGEIISEEFLPKFARQLRSELGVTQDVLRTPAAAIGKTQVAFAELAREVGQAGLNDAIVEVAESLTEFAQSADAASIAQDLGAVLKGLADAAVFVVDNFEGIKNVLATIISLKVGAWFGSIAVGAGAAVVAITPFVAWLTSLAPIAAVAGTGLFALTGPLAAIAAAVALTGAAIFALDDNLTLDGIQDYILGFLGFENAASKAEQAAKRVTAELVAQQRGFDNTNRVIRQSVSELENLTRILELPVDAQLSQDFNAAAEGIQNGTDSIASSIARLESSAQAIEPTLKAFVDQRQALSKFAGDDVFLQQALGIDTLTLKINELTDTQRKYLVIAAKLKSETLAESKDVDELGKQFQQLDTNIRRRLKTSKLNTAQTGDARAETLAYVQSLAESARVTDLEGEAGKRRLKTLKALTNQLFDAQEQTKALALANRLAASNTVDSTIILSKAEAELNKRLKEGLITSDALFQATQKLALARAKLNGPLAVQIEKSKQLNDQLLRQAQLQAQGISPSIASQIAAITDSTDTQAASVKLLNEALIKVNQTRGTLGVQAIERENQAILRQIDLINQGVRPEAAPSLVEAEQQGLNPEQVELTNQALERQRLLNLQLQQSIAPYGEQWRQIGLDIENVAFTLNTTLGDALAGTIDQISTAAANSLLWGDSFQDVVSGIAKSLATELVSALIKVGLQTVINQALASSAKAAADGAFIAGEIAKTPILAQNALLASISTFGAASAVGTSAFLSSLAVGKAAAIPAFANGGFVSGSGSGTSDSITARLSNGEFVVNAQATRENRGMLEAVNNGATVVGGTSNGGGVNVEIVNNTSASIGNAEVQRLDENNVRIIITEELDRQFPQRAGAELSAPYSPATRSLNSRYRLPQNR